MNDLPDTDPDPTAVWLQTVRAYEAAAALLDRRLAADGLSLAQFDLLAALAALGEATQQALADRMLLSKSGTAALLSRTERRGLVTRSPDPVDGRAKRARLTPAGRQALARALELQAHVVSETVGRLDPETRRGLDRAMRDIESAVRQGESPRPTPST